MSFRKKNFRLNMSTSRKSINTQPRGKNPITILPKKDSRRPIKPKQQPTNCTKQKTLPIKLPPINKIDPPQPVIVHRPPPLLPPIHLPSIKDRVIRQNLTQKPALRCKTPRPISVYSFTRSNTIAISEPDEPTKTHHPLQVSFHDQIEFFAF